MTTIGWRFDLRDEVGLTRNIGFTATGSVGFDINRDIPKIISGFTLVPEEAAKVTLEVDQVLAYLVIDDVEHSMGTFNFSDVVSQKEVVRPAPPMTGAQDLLRVGLADECQRLQRNDGSAQTIFQNFDPSEEMRILLDTTDLPYAISGSDYLAGSSVTWDGSTTLLAKLRQLGELAGHRPLWMDRNGVIRSVPSGSLYGEKIELASLKPDAGSITVTDYYLTAPNRVIVSDNSGGSHPIVGQWDAPGSAPHSASKRGYVTTEVVSMQGLGSSDHANIVAATLGEKFTSRKLTARILPTYKLDGPVTITYDGSDWLVSSWSVGTQAGEMMDIEAEEYSPGSVS